MEKKFATRFYAFILVVSCSYSCVFLELIHVEEVVTVQKEQYEHIAQLGLWACFPMLRFIILNNSMVYSSGHE